MGKDSVVNLWMDFIEKYKRFHLSRRQFFHSSAKLAVSSAIAGSIASGLIQNCTEEEFTDWSHLPISLQSYETTATDAHRILAERHSSVLLLGPPNNNDLLKLITHLYTKEAAELAVLFPNKIWATMEELKIVTGKTEDEIKAILHPVVHERHVIFEISRIIQGMQGYQWMDDMIVLLSEMLESMQTLIASIIGIDMVVDPAVLINGTTYMISPIIPPMFESNFMYGIVTPWHKRYAHLFDKIFSTGYWQDYVRDNGEVTILRSIPIEESLDVSMEVLNSDRFSDLVNSVDDIVLLSCQCAFLKYLQDKPCKMENKRPDKKPCIIAGPVAKTLIEMGWAEPATKEEVMTIRDATANEGAVHITFNVQNSDCFYVCACCSCCCQLIQVIRDFECPNVIAQPHFIPQLNLDNCSFCQKCTEFCQMTAHDFSGGSHSIDPLRCIGCGQCIRVCPKTHLADENKAIRWIENPAFTEAKPITDYAVQVAVKVLPIVQKLMAKRGDQTLIK